MNEKEDLIGLLNELLVPLGFKRKGNNWLYNGETISKKVNLQRSYYSKFYYINYGFIILKLDLTTDMHVWYRLAGVDKEQNARVNDLLNLEKTIEIGERLNELRSLISNQIVSKMKFVDNQDDLLVEIKKLPTLNVIPLIVKQYFNLP